MTEAEIEAQITARLDERIAKLNAERDATKAENIARLEKANADHLADLAAQKPGWKSTEFWLALIPTVSGLVMSLAGAFGVDPQHLEVAQQVVGTVTTAATGLASGGDPTEVVTGAVMGTLPAALYILKRTARKP